MSRYTIGQVAERTGFSTSTLRYYERTGLLPPAGRTDAGYRVYDDASLARLRFIDRAKQLGCTLQEIADLAELWAADECGPVHARLHELVTGRIADAHERRRELVAFTAQLETAAAHLGGDPVDGPCHDGCACLGEIGVGRSVPAAAGDPAHPPIVCTLPAEELTDRMDGWQAVLAHVTRRDRTVDGGLRLTFDQVAPLDEVTRLAAAEQGCCSFFAFAITIDERGIALEIRAPGDAVEILTAVFGEAA
jgi:MerR family copper efflux transcriptional regulator